MRDLLLPSADAYRRDAAAHYAARLAARFGGSLTALYAVQPFLGGPEMNSPGMLAEAVGYLLEQRNAAMEGARPFLQWARQQGVGSAAWRSSEAMFASAIASVAHWYDVVVLQADAESELGSAQTLGKILLTCGRSCIVVRDNVDAPPRRIAVAWNGSVECIRAVRSSRYLLQRADRVVLLHSERAEDASGLAQITEYLSRHEVRVDPVALPVDDDTPGESLLAAAESAGADLLVMGAYGHSRFSEWVFGGATRHVLEHARLPVFMRH